MEVSGSKVQRHLDPATIDVCAGSKVCLTVCVSIVLRLCQTRVIKHQTPPFTIDIYAVVMAAMTNDDGDDVLISKMVSWLSNWFAGV